MSTLATRLPPQETPQEHSVDDELQTLAGAGELDSALARVEQEREAAVTAFESVLTEEHARALEPVLNAMYSNDEGKRPPRFDLRLIQRYVLWRVFDLGWTTERFGHFDRYTIRYQGREASKAERIGKKYQWIAYHEIKALVADHFQYRERFREEDRRPSLRWPLAGIPSRYRSIMHPTSHAWRHILGGSLASMVGCGPLR